MHCGGDSEGREKEAASYQAKDYDLNGPRTIQTLLSTGAATEARDSSHGALLRGRAFLPNYQCQEHDDNVQETLGYEDGCLDHKSNGCYTLFVP